MSIANIGGRFNGYAADGRRLYFKGGDGGAAEAQQAEAERQARINAAVATINNIFDSKPITRGVNKATAYDKNKTYYDANGNVYKPPTTIIQKQGVSAVNGLPIAGTQTPIPGLDNTSAPTGTQVTTPTNTADTYIGEDQDAINRAIADGLLFTDLETSTTSPRSALYDEQKKAVFDINKRDIDRQFAEAERANRFSLARNGLLGGSADVDSNAQLQQKTNEGLIKAAGLGDSAAAELRTADERARQSLISMAQSGIDTGTAQQMALSNLNATAQSAAGNRAGATIGNIFNDMSQAYLMNQARSGAANGGNTWQQRYPNLAASSSSGDQGSVIR